MTLKTQDTQSNSIGTATYNDSIVHFYTVDPPDIFYFQFAHHYFIHEINYIVLQSNHHLMQYHCFSHCRTVLFILWQSYIILQCTWTLHQKFLSHSIFISLSFHMPVWRLKHNNISRICSNNLFSKQNSVIIPWLELRFGKVYKFHGFKNHLFESFDQA